MWCVCGLPVRVGWGGAVVRQAPPQNKAIAGKNAGRQACMHAYMHVSVARLGAPLRRQNLKDVGSGQRGKAGPRARARGRRLGRRRRLRRRGRRRSCAAHGRWPGGGRGRRLRGVRGRRCAWLRRWRGGNQSSAVRGLLAVRRVDWLAVLQLVARGEQGLEHGVGIGLQDAVQLRLLLRVPGSSGRARRSAALAEVRVTARLH